MDGSVFWVDTDSHATVGSIKQSIMASRGIDIVMQKLICAGKLLQDESTPELSGVTENDFLVLVTAKPRPPSLVSTGAPLPSSYQAHVTVGVAAAEDGSGVEDETRGEVDDDVLDASGRQLVSNPDSHGHHENAVERCEDLFDNEVARFVEMGFDAHDACQAMRLASNQPRRALVLLRSGQLSSGEEAMRLLQDRLQSLPAFHSLQQVVRVDPQIMVRC